MTFLFACKSEDNGNNDKPVNNDTTVVKDKVIIENDTTVVELTDDEANLKSGELVKKTDDINNKLDELLENL